MAFISELWKIKMNLSELLLNNQTLQTMALNTTKTITDFNCSGFISQGNTYIFIASIILFIALMIREQFFQESKTLLCIIMISAFFILMISFRIVLLK
jgi:hypothetical protein